MISATTYNFIYENLEYFDEVAKSVVTSDLGEGFIDNNKLLLVKNEDLAFRIGLLAKISLQKNGKDISLEQAKRIFFKEEDITPTVKTGVFSCVVSHNPSSDFKPLSKAFLDYIATNTFPKKMLSIELCKENALVYEIPYTIMDKSEEMLVSDSEGEEIQKKKVFVTKFESGILKQAIYLNNKKLTIIKNDCKLLENYDLSKYFA